MRRHVTGAAGLGLFLALLRPAAADPAAATTTEPHRKGLFLAAEAGYAGHDLSRGSVKAYGRGADLRIEVGGLLTPRIALFGGYANFLSTSVTWDSGGSGAPKSMDDAGLDAASFFLGGRGYFPYGLYLEGAAGTLTERLDIGGTGGVGAMGQLAVGKEWRLISGLTLDTSVRAGLGRVPRNVGAAVSARQLGIYLGFGYCGDEY